MKKQKWNWAGALSPVQQGGEMKSPAMMMMIRLPLANASASGCLANQSLDFMVGSVK